MDFFRICTKERKGEPTVLYPDFTVGRSRDLMVRAGSFYAIWDDKRQLWSTDEYDVQRLVDEELNDYAVYLHDKTGEHYAVQSLSSFGTNGWSQFRKFMKNVSDNSHPLDENLTFSNTATTKSDYVSKRLSYPLEEGDYSAWDELVGTLYSVEERQKIEWAIGSVIAGDSKKIQKFVVLYGAAGTGKSTILNVVQKLFDGYTTTFEAKALGSSSGSFATEVFKHNPLVAIQHDGDLSKIEDNTRLNSIVSHEEMTMNEKFKPSYTSRVNAFLFMGTNLPVKISDAKSGIIRRLIDVHPTGVTIPANHYNTLMSQIEFQLGAIAHHCYKVYQSMGKNYYNAYRPLEMMLQTDVFFNFIEAYFDVFKAEDGVSLKRAYMLYKEFCGDTGVERILPQYKVRGELQSYFDEFHERYVVGGEQVRSYYTGFNANKFKAPAKGAKVFSLVVEETESILDEELSECPAQLANEDDIPQQSWSKVRTTLNDIDTTKTHFVRVPETHIVIDFDLKGEDGGKSLERNLEAASAWPPTYAELSKSGSGVHLHYNYTGGDPGELNPNFSEGIEVKVYRGASALRRRLSRCNNLPVSDISSGLPLKEKKVLSDTTIKTEKGLRDLIQRNLEKKIHPSTKSSVSFIHHILEEAYDKGFVYDVTDLKPRIMSFAHQSSNQALLCMRMVQTMKFKSEHVDPENPQGDDSDKALTFYDVEVFPNLFAVCWKYEDSPTVTRMVNPSPAEMEALVKMKLVGFYNRRYDNHIVYARILGYDNAALFRLSQKLISNEGYFGEAYNLSYADIYDYASIKQTLKKWEIALGIKHMENDIPWDQDVPEDKIEEVLDYCENDVRATEQVHKARKGDFVARQILAELSGLTVNDTTQKHTAKIIFGNDRNPQSSFSYVDLSNEFPGYTFEMGKSSYKGENPSEGGYVYAEPGMYEDVVVLDVASMHPTSIIQMNLFGKYTKNFTDLYLARLAIKSGDLDAARKMLNGRLAPFLEDESTAKDLGYALKIVINIVYGLTAAKFDNAFRDIRNVDNVVAKRGALFMIDLKHFVEDKGWPVAHIKTDSIKIPGATQEMIDAVTEFGKRYGYQFEHESTYSKFCLVNDAVYVAKTESSDGDAHWEAVGAQFQHPYVYKTLFSKEEIHLNDLFEPKSVAKGVMYLDFDHKTPDDDPAKRPMIFVGRTGLFVPVTADYGGVLYRVVDDKKFAVTGTKNRLWMESRMAEQFTDDLDVDMDHFENLVSSAMSTIAKYGDVDEFLN